MSGCHCVSGRPYEACCAPYISGEAIPPTAEALMRSRYSAYVENAIDYLGETLHPDHRHDWDRDATRRWSEGAQWLALEIVDAPPVQPDEDEAWVEFIATFDEGGKVQKHHERSRFARHRGRWYYVDGQLPKPQTLRHEAPRVGRNDPCPCGSGKKYKKCCGA